MEKAVERASIHTVYSIGLYMSTEKHSFSMHSRVRHSSGGRACGYGDRGAASGVGPAGYRQFQPTRRCCE